MPLVSDEYCGRCGEQRAVVEAPFVGGVRWKCIDCGNVVDIEFDDDEETMDWATERVLKGRA